MSTQTIKAFVKPTKSLSPEDEGFKAFKITPEDKNGLELPGCKAIEEIRLGRHTLPQIAEHKVPIDTTDKNFQQVEIPLYTLDEGSDGIPILLRSLNSNDGMWQEGETLYIKAQWDTDQAKSKK